MLNGVINVYKEKGFTSHDVVARMRGIFKQRKIGHTGTLDPDAEGVLPVCLGSATKLCDMLTDRSKTYEAVLLLGITTDTEDAGGTVLSERSVTCTAEEAVSCVRSFEGPYLQVPPMYSAIKVNGKKLVDLARKGITVERKARPVEIYSISVSETALPRIRFSADCSKGTYIRTLCSDIGERLGCGGIMESLVRTRSGRFGIADAVRLETLEECVRDGEPGRFLVPPEECFPELPKLWSLPEGDRFLRNGNPLKTSLADLSKSGLPELPEGYRARVYDSAGRFAGLFCEKEGLLRPEKMFLS